MATKKKDETVEDKKVEAVETVEAIKEEKPKETTKAASSDKKEEKPKKPTSKAKAAPAKSKKEVAVGDVATETKTRKRAEKVGVVWSDKMMKTVVVRVERMVKHPLYHKYMKRRKKFMAHDELGASEGDRVRIVETRPLSAKKRWRVVEIIQKAEK